MSHPLYAVLTFTCTFVLLIFMNQFRVILDKKEKSDREFFTLSNWVTFFCLQDSFWGLCSIGLIQNHFVFFISSTIFHATAAISACIWLSYILNFIGLRRRKVLLAEIIAILLVLFQFVLLTRNFETKYIFDISPEGEYITRPGRNLLFYSQFFTFLIIAGLTAQKFFSEKHKSTKRHYLSGLLFIFAPVICATLQETFPFAPCYSIGFMLGSCTIYAFVISEMSQERFLSQRAVIVAGLSSDYDLVMFVDITKNQANFFQVSPKFSKLLETVDPKLPDNLKFDTLMRRIINPSELNDFIETTYRDHCLTILKDAPSHMIPFTANIDGQTEHYRLKIASNSSNANSFVVGVICFEEEHRLEEKAQILKKNLQHTMLIASRDAVTGVGSAAAFKSKCDQLDKQIKSNHAPNFAIVECDVNNLKTMNDTYGHDKGDAYLKNCCRVFCNVFLHSPVYRIGGDEFAIVLQNSDFDDRAELFELLKMSVIVKPNNPHQSISFAAGMSDYDRQTDKSSREVLKRADELMYTNKVQMKQEK